MLRMHGSGRPNGGAIPALRRPGRVRPTSGLPNSALCRLAKRTSRASTNSLPMPRVRPRILAMLTTGVDERRSTLIYEVLGLWAHTANKFHRCSSRYKRFVRIARTLDDTQLHARRLTRLRWPLHWCRYQCGAFWRCGDNRTTSRVTSGAKAITNSSLTDCKAITNGRSTLGVEAAMIATESRPPGLVAR